MDLFKKPCMERPENIGYIPNRIVEVLEVLLSLYIEAVKSGSMEHAGRVLSIIERLEQGRVVIKAWNKGGSEK